MKKLLNCLAIMSLFSSSTAFTVSCGTGFKEPDSKDPNWNEKDMIFDLFGEQFTSKEAAIAFFTNEKSGVKIEEEVSYNNELLLGEQKFKDINQMFEYINEMYPIKEQLTNKNPDNFIMDGMNQLTSEVVTDTNEQIKIYKDKNGKVISNVQDNEIAYQEAKESYFEDIEKRYVVNDQEFRTKDDIENYFIEKFLNSSKLNEEKVYSMGGNLVYTEEGLRGEIRNSIRTQYNYNGIDFLDEQINDLSVVKPTQEDEQNIQKFNPSPGSYLIEATGSDKGQYTGDKIIQSDIDLTEIIRSKEKWVLESSDSSSVKDFIYDSINSAIVSIIGFLNNLLKLENKDVAIIETTINSCTEDRPTIYNIFDCYDNKKSYDKFEALINEYDLNAEIGAIVQNVATIQTLSFSEKAGIILYQIQEAFRYSNIGENSSNSEQLNTIMYDLLLNLDSNNVDWVNFIKELGVNNSNLGFQYLVEPSVFYENIDYASNVEKILKLIESLTKSSKKFTTAKMEETIIIFSDFMAVLIKIGVKKETVKKLEKFVSVLSKCNLYLGIVTTFLDLIPFSTTNTYTLHIPNSSKILKYQITNDWFNKNEFNPADIFNVIELKKPIKNETYFYNNKYYASYNDAYLALKRNIMNSVLKSNNIKYFSNQKPDWLFDTKEELIDELVKYFKNTSTAITDKYTDFFGVSYSNEREAYEEMIKKVNEGSHFQTVFKYDYSTSEISNNIIYADSYKNLKEIIEQDLEIETKVASISQLNQGIVDFDKIEDLSKFAYKIYTFTINGMHYYFKDPTNATYFIMKLLNYKNILVQNVTQKYSLNGNTFENIHTYIDYLYSNIIEIERGELK